MKQSIISLTVYFRYCRSGKNIEELILPDPNNSELIKMLG